MVTTQTGKCKKLESTFVNIVQMIKSLFTFNILLVFTEGGLNELAYDVMNANIPYYIRFPWDIIYSSDIAAVAWQVPPHDFIPWENISHMGCSLTCHLAWS